ncbi:MAG: oligoendopeptidase F [Oscillospiraceae bacterium]|nr:oligoendopeptidase F [Oscillospiraceae bacterium]MDD4414721.1 oligoendopeptidase F [Oscillospiraceae bacterium]
MEYKSRNDIPAEYKWRLTDIYPDQDSWEAALGLVQADAEKLTGYQGKMGESRETLRSGLRLFEQLEKRLERVYMYAKLNMDVDNSDAKYQAMHDRTLGILFKIQEGISFITPELTAMDPDTLRDWVYSDEQLTDFRHMIDDIIRNRAHVLSTREERLMAMAAPALESLDSAYSMLESVDLKLGEITDEKGNKVVLTHGLFGKLRDSRDRRVRSDAFAALHGAFAGMGNTIASLYTGSVRSDVFGTRARGFESSLDRALFSDNLSSSIYTGLIDAVHSHLPSYHRYLELRRRILGVEKLHIYDTYVPIIDIPVREYTYEQACDVVRRYLVPLGAQYLDDLDSLLEGGWVDVYETPGKATGAYAAGVYGVHPYMLLNFVGNLNDVFTLAHEAGHCMHTLYSDKQPYMNKDYPIFLAEIASTVNENILMRMMIDGCDVSKPEGRREKAYLINRFLEEYKGTVFRQTMFAEFELKVHEMAERGEPLTGETLCDVYRELLGVYFGPDVEIDDYMRWEWARIPHFYRAFYVYKYATGFSAASAISRALSKEGNVERYLELLSAGESDYPAETLKRAGIDLTVPAPINEALDEFESLLNEFEELL